MLWGRISSACAAITLLGVACGEPSKEAEETQTAPSTLDDQTHQSARWHPIHFDPAIGQASNEDCLKCHREVVERRVRTATQAGTETASVRAWYQELDTYEGEQDTFHRRHLVTPLATELMSMRCNTCHRGNDPREESEPQFEGQFTLRKMVNPDTCLMCHGQFDDEIMGLPGPWHEVAETFQNSCLVCHNGIRTTRHQVNYLDADAIEAAATARGGDVCFGCHGGRAWYATSFPYPRHPWPGMAEATPEWARGRPTQSDPRFLGSEGGEPQ